MSKHYRWCFTINNPTDGDETKMLNCFSKRGTLQYFAQDEIGKNGTPHLQGCVVFKCQRTMSAVAKDFPRARLSVMYKALAANRSYCTKEETRAPNGRRWSSSLSAAKVPEREKCLEALETLRLAMIKRIIDRDMLDKICRGWISDQYI